MKWQIKWILGNKKKLKTEKTRGLLHKDLKNYINGNLSNWFKILTLNIPCSQYCRETPTTQGAAIRKTEPFVYVHVYVSSK